MSPARKKSAAEESPRSSVDRGLDTYRKKRDFEKTNEPASSREQGPEGRRVYAIQEHHASRLHYDLRLEDGGVLKSWAVPKTPPEKDGVRRLAVQTEDHPLGYETFEGVIPEGEYGAGRVKIWDSGTYELLENDPGKKVLRIDGRRLRGRFALIKLKPKNGDDDSWLFFKLKDKG
ncbi:MAG: DNA polymerase ligase N-terminal domain-containing protein [Acidobacteriota bacterium]|nr:DNA polymerase ligase N-terminal domain-containing protein [Acidobacteriota bacterium]